MKKKILHGFLVSVMLLAGMSSFVACKDYDEDSYNELKTLLNSEINARETLKKQYDALEAKLAGIKQCECKLDEYLKSAEAKGIYLSQTDAASIYATKTLLNDAINEIKSTLGTVDPSTQGSVAQQISTMNTTIVNIQSEFGKAVEVLADNDSILGEDLSALKDSVSSLSNTIAIWTPEIKKAQKDASDALAKYKSLEALVEGNRYSVDSLANVVKSIDLTKYVTKDELAAAKKEALDAAAKAEKLASDAMAKAETALTNAETALTNAEEAGKKAIAAQDSANAAKAEAIKAQEAANDAKKDANIAKESADEAQKKADEAQKKADEAWKKAEDAQKKADEAWSKANANEKKIGEIEEALKNFVTKEEFNKAVKELNDSISKLDERLTNLETKVNKLMDDVLKRMITGVIIQGTNNPIFGSISLPLDARSTLLATYWGEYTKAVNFPYADNEDQYYYSDQYTAFSSSPVMYLDKNVTIGSGRHLLNEDGGVASLGKLYMTINPAEVDFEGNQPLKGLFTSGSETQAPVTIDALQHSNTDMYFGMTRGANNGFYETDVKLDVADIDKARLQTDLKAIGSEVKNALNSRTMSSVAQMAVTVFKNIENVLPAYGAKVAWQDETTGENHSIYSQYNLGITAVKPVSFNFIDGLSDKIAPNDKVRGYDRLMNLSGRLFKEVKNKLHELYPTINREALVFKFQSITIGNGINPATGKSYDIQADADGKVRVTVIGTVSVNGQNDISGSTDTQIINGNPYKFTFTIPASDISATGNVSASADITSFVNDLVDAINSRYGAGSDVDKAFSELVNLVDEVIQLETDLDDMISDYEKRVNNKINSINNKLVKYIDYAERALQLTMIGTTNNASAMISQSKNRPTIVKGSTLTLFPTTFSMEVFAPAYMKFVAVTNVYDAATGAQATGYESLAKAANGDYMAETFSGRKKCVINGKAGYIYEVAYAAIDFHGKICVKKFYVQFQ